MITEQSEIVLYAM